MQQFNLKDYEKDPTNWALFIARGNPARLIVSDVKGKYPILCLVTSDSGYEYPIMVNEFGQEESGEDELTLIMDFIGKDSVDIVSEYRPFTKDEFYRAVLKHGHYIKNVKTGNFIHPVIISENGIYITSDEAITYKELLRNYVWVDSGDPCGYKI